MVDGSTTSKSWLAGVLGTPAGSDGVGDAMPEALGTPAGSDGVEGAMPEVLGMTAGSAGG